MKKTACYCHLSVAVIVKAQRRACVLPARSVREFTRAIQLFAMNTLVTTSAEFLCFCLSYLMNNVRFFH